MLIKLTTKIIAFIAICIFFIYAWSGCSCTTGLFQPKLATETPTTTPTNTTIPIPTATSSPTPSPMAYFSNPKVFTESYRLRFQGQVILYYEVTGYVSAYNSWTLNDFLNPRISGPAGNGSLFPNSGTLNTFQDVFLGFVSPASFVPDTAGVLYTFSATSASGMQISSVTAPVVNVFPIPTITAPSTLVSEPTGNPGSSFTLMWDPIPSTANYFVYLRANLWSNTYVGIVNGVSGQPWQGTATSANISGLTAGQSYVLFLEAHGVLDTTYNASDTSGVTRQFTD